MAKYTPEQRIATFWSKVDKSGGNDACWLWTAGKYQSGYGAYRWNGRTQKAHRVSFFLANGRWVKDGYRVCHTCDVRHCVNPLHLWEGTDQENLADRDRKKRQQHGERHFFAKLTEKDVQDIRELYAEGGISQKAIADKYGVVHQLISQIIRREIWVFVE